MTVALLLILSAFCLILISVLHIPLPEHISDRKKLQFWEFLLRLSVEYLGDIVELIGGARARNSLIRLIVAVPYVFRRSPRWCTVRTENIAGVPCRIYIPDASRRKTNGAIFFIHGGGWCIMRASYYDGPIYALMRRTGAAVVSVDYQLSPEVQSPSAINECEAVLKELYENKYKELGIDRERIAVMGDSAGGNLSTVLCQRLLRERKPYVKCQVLVYPVIHALDFLSPSHQDYYRNYKGAALLSPSGMARWYLLHLGIEATPHNIKAIMKNRHLSKELLESKEIMEIVDVNNLPSHFLGKDKYEKPSRPTPSEKLAERFSKLITPELCPLLAKDLQGLAPAFIATAGIDILRDEGVLYAKRLSSFGVPTKWQHYESAFHGVLHMPSSSMRTQILDDISAYLRQYL
ncbi:Protein F16F9.4 [Aphelenchoides avenae]|nr:Protein F16F9.4 [Aphelenchus avenae]